MPDISPIGWFLLGLAALLIGMAKTGLPGVATLAIIMVPMVIPAKQATGLILPMLIVGDIFAVAYWRRHASWGHLAKLIPFAAVGIVGGYFIMDRISNEQLRRTIGLIILGMLVLNYVRLRLAGDQLNIPSGWWFPAITGIAAGLTTMLANAAGPIMIIYLLAMRLPKEQFLGTSAWYFLLLNWFKVPFMKDLNLISPDSLMVNLALAPAIIIGAVAGVRLVKHVPEKAFNLIVQVLAVAGAVYLALKP